jgi:hypothetical protein
LWLSCCGCPVLAVLFWLSYPGCHRLTVYIYRRMSAKRNWEREGTSTKAQARNLRSKKE